MAKLQEKQRAIKLRKAGKSYSEIKQLLNVSKSTLSAWLRDRPLPPEKIRELRDWSQRRIEHYRETRQKKREELLQEIYNQERKRILPFSKRDLYIGGLFLYWGEGGKTLTSGLSFSNSDPAMARLFLIWLAEVLGIDKSKIKIRLQLYSDMDIKKEIDFWSKMIEIPLAQFKRPYIKKTTLRSLTYRGGFGHGTCNIIIWNAMLSKKVFSSLRILQDYFGPVA